MAEEEVSQRYDRQYPRHHKPHSTFTSQTSQYLHITNLTVPSHHKPHSTFTSQTSQYLHISNFNTTNKIPALPVFL